MVVVPLATDDSGRLAAAAAGDPSAIDWLLDDVAPTVYGFIFARVGGNEAAAEDLLQETLLEVLGAANSFRGEAAVSTWMCTIARRRLAQFYERERKADVVRSRLELVTDDGSYDPEADLERRDEVSRALGRLPALHRQVLVLKYLDDQPVEHIARTMGRSTVQVQSLLQRARDGLRRELSGKADD